MGHELGGPHYDGAVFWHFATYGEGERYGRVERRAEGKAKHLPDGHYAEENGEEDLHWGIFFQNGRYNVQDRGVREDKSEKRCYNPERYRTKFGGKDLGDVGLLRHGDKRETGKRLCTGV